jgi:hypothetical protein
MFQVPRNRKFYKERKDNTITREDDVKLFHFRNESVQWIADFLGNDDEETRGGALSSVIKNHDLNDTIFFDGKFTH